MNKKINIILLGALVTCTVGTSSVFATTGKVTGSSVRIREEASTTASIIETVKKGTEVEVESEEDDWYKVTYNDKTGYIYKDYIDVTLEDSEEEEATEETQENDEDTTEETSSTDDDTTSAQLSDTLYSDTDMYLTACYLSSKIGTLEKGTKITIQKTMANWSYITYKENSGWIPNYKLMEVSDTSEEETTETTDSEEGQKAYLSSTAANLREGPGTSYDVIGGVAEYEVLTVLSEEDGWYKVTTSDNITGYVLKSLVTIGERKVTSRSSSSREVTVVETKTSDNKTSTAKTESTSKTSSTTKSTTKSSNDSSSTSSASSSSSNVSTKRKKLVTYAKKYLGYDYVYGGESPDTGFDCSGFTKYVYGHYGYTLARSSSGQASNGTHVDKSDLKIGDLLIFTGHVGIYIGNNQFIHASNPSDGVKITSLSDSYYVKNYIDARRIIK